MPRKDPQREWAARPNAAQMSARQRSAAGATEGPQGAPWSWGRARQQRGCPDYFSTSGTVHAEGWLQVGVRS